MKSSYTTPMFSDQEIRNIANQTSLGIANWVRTTAKERNISILRTPSGRFARAASRLSDAETDLDQVERLLVALGRSRVITPFQRGLLQVHYLYMELKILDPFGDYQTEGYLRNLFKEKDLELLVIWKQQHLKPRSFKPFAP